VTQIGNDPRDLVVARRNARREKAFAAAKARSQKAYAAAKARTCPTCRKGAALGKPLAWDATAARKCRYCGYWAVAQ
jgi:predicted  nucleic acid-binding Zn ribbon protein